MRKYAPLHAVINKLRTDNKDLRRQLDELEQYGRRPLSLGLASWKACKHTPRSSPDHSTIKVGRYLISHPAELKEIPRKRPQQGYFHKRGPN